MRYSTANTSVSGTSKAMANRGLQAHISWRCEKPQGEAKAGKHTGLKPPKDKLYDHFPGRDGLAKHYTALYSMSQFLGQGS